MLSLDAGELPGTFEDLAQSVVRIEPQETARMSVATRSTRFAVEVAEHVA
jgi:hypothetical protein